jgi:hypothetical protein
MRLLSPAAALGLAVALIPAPTLAEPQCGPRDRVVALLADRYAETRRAMGLAGPNLVMEVYASEASRSWTITVTSPDGVTCLIASGQGFEALVEALPAQGSPA